MYVVVLLDCVIYEITASQVLPVILEAAFNKDVMLIYKIASHFCIHFFHKWKLCL